MPELPEVHTTTKQLKKRVIREKVKDVWSDWPKSLQVHFGGGLLKIKKTDLSPNKKTLNKILNLYKKILKDKKIIDVSRKGKNILIFFSGDILLLVHQKLSGHLLYGEWEIKDNIVIPKNDSFLKEKVNGYIHFILIFHSGKMLALSDLRKFAKIVLGRKDDILNLKELREIGKDPIFDKLSFEEFFEIIRSKRKPIKMVLMDQKNIAGIGNIYSDEILWEAKIHPKKEANKLSKTEAKRIYDNMLKILKFAIKLKGDSMSDYRNLDGKKGGFQNYHNVYRREGEKCRRCGAFIERIKFGNRSSYFCPKCQIL